VFVRTSLNSGRSGGCEFAVVQNRHRIRSAGNFYMAACRVFAALAALADRLLESGVDRVVHQRNHNAPSARRQEGSEPSSRTGTAARARIEQGLAWSRKPRTR